MIVVELFYFSVSAGVFSSKATCVKVRDSLIVIV